jgi:homopolymeric O-antigen transport system permease protein
LTVYADLFRYRELFGNLFRRDLRAKYKGSVLGVAWTLAYPLILMGIYLLVFSKLYRLGASVPHYALFLLSGLAVWTFFATSLQNASRSMLDNANLIRKVRFPRQLVPFSVVATQLVTLGVMLVVLVVLNVAIIPETRKTFWLALVLAVPLVAFVGGVCLALASLDVLFRDVEHLLASLLLPWFFLTPIIYSFSQFHHHTMTQILRYANPITPPIEAIRAPLLGSWPNVWDVVYLCVACVVSLALGAWVFNRVDDRIAVEL